MDLQRNQESAWEMGFPLFLFFWKLNGMQRWPLLEFLSLLIRLPGQTKPAAGILFIKVRSCLGSPAISFTNFRHRHHSGQPKNTDQWSPGVSSILRDGIREDWTILGVCESAIEAQIG